MPTTSGNNEAGDCLTIYNKTARQTWRRWSANKPHKVRPGRFESKRPSNNSSHGASLGISGFISLIESRIALQCRVHVKHVIKYKPRDLTCSCQNEKNCGRGVC